MFLATRPFAEAAGEGLPDVTEVAIAQVQKKFLDAIGDLDPRMVPGVGLV